MRRLQIFVNEFKKLLKVLKKAYETSIRKKVEYDMKRMEEIEMVSMGSSPMGTLKSLISLDFDRQ